MVCGWRRDVRRDVGAYAEGAGRRLAEWVVKVRGEKNTHLGMNDPWLDDRGIGRRVKRSKDEVVWNSLNDQCDSDA
jgi:hypothetical protein